MHIRRADIRTDEKNHLVTPIKRDKKRISLSANSEEFNPERSPKWLEVGIRIERKSPPDKRFKTTIRIPIKSGLPRHSSSTVRI
jgi:hypothetical protein